jgi:hypothetical protein
MLRNTRWLHVLGLHVHIRIYYGIQANQIESQYFFCIRSYSFTKHILSKSLHPCLPSCRIYDAGLQNSIWATKHTRSSPYSIWTQFRWHTTILAWESCSNRVNTCLRCKVTALAHTGNQTSSQHLASTQACIHSYRQPNTLLSRNTVPLSQDIRFFLGIWEDFCDENYANLWVAYSNVFGHIYTHRKTFLNKIYAV